MIPFKTIAASAILLMNTYALAQEKPLIITTPDTSYVSHLISLDSVIVTPQDVTPGILKRNRVVLSHGNPVHRLAAETELSTVIPGVTAELERDLPGLINFYTINGLPILTKQTQNHSLTPTLPYTHISPDLSEPNAMLSGSDAVITLTPTYEATRNIFIGPLHQAASIATGDKKVFSAALVAEHSSPGPLEDVIEELSAYANTYSGLANARIKSSRTQLDITAQHQYSDNEFGALFDVHLFRETDVMSSGFATATHDFGLLTLEAGYGHQKAKARTQLDEIYKDFHTETETLRANSYKFAMHLNETSLAFLYHDVQRKLADSAETGVQNAQFVLMHGIALTKNLHFNLNTRLDHNDHSTRPSISIQSFISPGKNLLLEVNLAHLYDPVINQSMNSGLRDATVFSDPITTNYASIKTSYNTQEWLLSTSITAKKVSLSWYEQSSQIEGAILGASAQRTISWNEKAFALRLTARKRWLDLETPKQKTQMPGPAPLQVGFRAEYVTENFGITLDAHYHSSRTQSLSDEFTTSLGDLILFNVGLTKRFGPVNTGLSIGNVFGMFRENKMYAYQKRINEHESEVEYIVAPPFIPGISLNLDF